MELQFNEKGFSIIEGDKILFTHSEENPAIFVGKGKEKMDIYRGNFDIEDYVIERYPLKAAKEKDGKIMLSVCPQAQPEIELFSELKDNHVKINIKACDETINRIWIRIPAQKEEYVWGCGEQMSYFNLRGRHFPLWTSEPGVGRDKTTEITFLSDKYNKAGGDYYHTNYPQPTFVSSRYYACHVNSTAYADFDFRNEMFHELQIWEVPESIEFFTADTYLGIVEKLSDRFGKQPQPLFLRQSFPQ